MGYFDLIGKYRECSDTLILYSGFFGAFCFGLFFPGFCVAFANMIDDVGGQADLDSLKF